jgi:hypothetical protein
MRRQTRPTGVTVIAVLQLIFGGLGLCGTLVGAGGQAMRFQASSSTGTAQGTVTQQDFETELERRAPGYKAVQVTELIVGFVTSGLMIASGIGLLNMRPWGRTTAIVYAALSIAVRIPSVIYSAAFVLPAMNAVLDTLPGANQGPGAAVAQGIKFGLIFGLVIGFLTIIYPIIVLCVMLNGKVSAAFRKAAARRDDEDEDDRGFGRDDDYDDDGPDDYDDRRPRRRDTRYRDR